MSRRRLLGGSAMVLVVLATTPGCTEGPCPAVQYGSTLIVEAEPGSEVADVEVCVADQCESSVEATLETPAVVDAIPETSSVGDSTGPAWAVVTQLSKTSWSFEGLDQKEEVQVRSLAEDGGLVAETSITPVWERVGGTEECGGPMEAVINAPTR